LILRDSVHHELRQANPDAEYVQKPKHAPKRSVAALFPLGRCGRGGGSKHKAKNGMKKKEREKHEAKMGQNIGEP
jgi:hypothetical protein